MAEIHETKKLSFFESKSYIILRLGTTPVLSL